MKPIAPGSPLWRLIENSGGPPGNAGLRRVDVADDRSRDAVVYVAQWHVSPTHVAVGEGCIAWSTLEAAGVRPPTEQFYRKLDARPILEAIEEATIDFAECFPALGVHVAFAWLRGDRVAPTWEERHAERMALSMVGVWKPGNDGVEATAAEMPGRKVVFRWTGMGPPSDKAAQ
jgi:hypothetical protein